MPGAVVPFTEATVPVTCRARGGTTTTSVAVTMSSLVRAPRACTWSPVHTFPNDGALTSLSLNVVDGTSTSTVNGVPWRFKEKSPGAPGVPHAPAALEPSTDPTVPVIWWWLWTRIVTAPATPPPRALPVTTVARAVAAMAMAATSALRRRLRTATFPPPSRVNWA